MKYLLISTLALTVLSSATAQQQSPYRPGGPYPPSMGTPGQEGLVVPGQTLGLRPYAFVEQYDLSETANGRPFVDEEGQFYGIGVQWSAAVSPNLRLDLTFEAFTGEVDYDGGLQDLFTGETTPLQGTTDYVGVRAEGVIVYPYPLTNGLTLEPLLGLGLRSFSRDLGSPSEGGYTEDWTSLYGLVGFGLNGHLGGGSHWFAKGALGYPFSNNNSTERGNQDDLSPGREPFWFAELGLRRGRLEVAGFYKLYQYSESDTAVVNNGFFQTLVRQPETEISLVGVRVGWQF